MNVVANPLDVFTEEQRDFFRQDFVDNECDTDEYRETNPAKGMSYYADLLSRLSDNPEATKAAVALGSTWHVAMLKDWGTPGWRSVGYAGAKELEPILTQLFDLIWAEGETPYGETVAELQEKWEDR